MITLEEKTAYVKFKYVAPPGMEEIEKQEEATPNEIHTEVNKDHTQTTTTKQMPTFARIRTPNVARICKDDGQEPLVELLKQIREKGWNQHIQRVTRMWYVGPTGRFTITFNTTKSKIIDKYGTYK